MMNTFTVLKPFPHSSRRLAVGTEVTEADLAGSPIEIADLKKGRYIVASDTKTAEAASAKAEIAPLRVENSPSPDEPSVIETPVPETEPRKR